jgi:acyl dehydratase
MKNQLYFEDVEVGTEIPPLVKGPYMVMDLAKFGAMIGDFYPTHYDHEWAIEKDRVPAAVVYGLQIASHLSQLLTDWIAFDGVLKRFSNRVTAQVYVGDTLTLKGKVTRKYAREGDSYVECELWGEKQDGTKAVVGSATIALPSKHEHGRFRGGLHRRRETKS